MIFFFTEFFHSLIQSLGKHKIIHRFQNVVHGVHGVTPNGVLNHVCDKDQDHLPVKLPDPFGGGHSVHKAHLNIQQNDIIFSGVIFQNILSVPVHFQADFVAAFPAVPFQVLLHLIYINSFIFHQCDSDHGSSFPCKTGFPCPADLFLRSSAFR